MNLNAYADNEYFHLKIKINDPMKSQKNWLQIFAPEKKDKSHKAKSTSMDSDFDEIILQIDERLNFLDGYILRVLKEFAAKGRLKLL